LQPMVDSAGLVHLESKLDQEALMPIYDTIALVRAKLVPTIALIGFCGAPWTSITWEIATEIPAAAPAMRRTSLYICEH
jgi:uroporphyrinogen decarboxylase